MSNTFERNERKVTFDAAAADYDAARPGYPEGLIDDVVRITGIPDNGRILEIGCGSGQATRSFAPRGYDITGIDISSALVRIASDHFADRSNVHFTTIGFEEFDESVQPFDLIVAATSWHWVDPALRYHKAARLLNDTGSLVILANLFPEPFYTGFFLRAQDVYREVVPEWGEPGSTKTTMDLIRETEHEMRDTGLFRDVIVCEHTWQVTYDRDQYCRLLTTYSDHLLLGRDRLNRLLDGLRAIIDEEYGGMVVRPYVSIGYIGRL